MNQNQNLIEQDIISLDEEHFDNYNDILNDPNLVQQVFSESTHTANTDFERTLTLSHPDRDEENIENEVNNDREQDQRENLVGEVHPHLDELGILDLDIFGVENYVIVNEGVFGDVDIYQNYSHLPIALRPYREGAIAEHYGGRMNLVCAHCNAFYKRSETNYRRRYTKCCREGTVQIALLQDPPQPLADLFNRNHPYSDLFFKNIRILNSAFSFVSLGVNLDHRFANAQRGGYTFRIHGGVYHRIGGLQPFANNPARFAQIFFYDTGEQIYRRDEIVNRENRDNQIPIELLEQLQNCFNEHNVLLQQFVQIGTQVLQNDNLNMIIKDNLPNLDRRVFNVPTTGNEIAAVIPATNPENGSRCIIIKRRDNRIQYIKETHCAIDPLTYILLFPRGELGWHFTMKKSNGDNMTILDYVRFLIHFRSENFNILMKSSKLWQQFLVDCWVRVETLRLLFIRLNQDRLRCDLYRGVADALRLDPEQNYGTGIGRFVVLPSTFVGGPRFMTQLYQDAMAVVRKYGKPHLFITMTTNPNWPEIQQELLPGQTSWDRPEVVTREFKNKLEELIKKLKNGVLGNLKARIYVVEFQKRGLPHAHILLIMEQGYHFDTVEQIDNLISAELPDPVNEPLLFEKVTKFMIHRPCESNINACCKVNGKCSKNFPKPHIESTCIDQGAYPKYRRSRHGARIRIDNQEIGNEYVVPYNKYLLNYFNCHINVEACGSLQAVKYLYKYVYKGFDCATVQISPENRNDEIFKFVSGRYVSASEACYRLFSFRLHQEFPNVYRLTIHLENHQNVYFRPGEDLQRILNRNETTMLTAWFTSNRECPQGRNLLYADYPEYFKWEKRPKKWTLRQRNIRTVGRIYNVSVKDGEKFYLRVMLNHIKGATSWQSLRTVNDIVYNTYREAAIALGVIRSDREWLNLLDDALLTQPTPLCREMFAFLLIFCTVSDPNEMWNTFRERLSDDLIHRYTNIHSREDCINLTLILIEQILRTHGRQLSDFNLPEPRRNTIIASNLDRNLIEEELGMNTDADIRNFETQLNNLTSDQRSIYNNIMREVTAENVNRNMFFINASGGTGKTYLLNTLLAAVRTQGDIALAVASSGIASLLLRNGRTAHSRFKIPLNCTENSICNIPIQSDLANLIRRAKLIVWDEVVMADKRIIQCVERTLRKLITPTVAQQLDNRTTKFGGKIVVFGGDFRQILPVVPMGGREEIISACFKQSYLWPHFIKFQLTQNLRIQNLRDPNNQFFSDWLLAIGDGQFGVHDDARNELVRLPQTMVHQNDDLNEFISSVYPDLNTNCPDPFSNSAILAPTNLKVDEINQRVLELFKPEQEIFTYLSADSLGEEESETNQLNITPEFLNSLNFSSIPPHRLNLKIGSIVMLIRNLNIKRGLCNGTRLIVQECRANYIKVKIITRGQFLNQLALIPKITVTSSPQDQYPFLVHRHQIPVKLAFAMTINKSQGQTLSRVGAYLERPVFTHGQLYVAFSRVEEKQNIKVFLSDENELSTKNIVYREIFV